MNKSPLRCHYSEVDRKVRDRQHYPHNWKKTRDQSRQRVRSFGSESYGGGALAGTATARWVAMISEAIHRSIILKDIMVFVPVCSWKKIS